MMPEKEKLQRIVLVTACILAGCETVSEVQPLGSETYTVSAEMNGQLPTWPEVKSLAIKRANEFCAENSKLMEFVDWDTHGERGKSALHAGLTFKCIDRPAQ